MPRIKRHPCPAIIKQFETSTDVLELFTMKDTNHRWSGACGVLHDKENRCRVATDAATILVVPSTKRVSVTQVYVYRRVYELDLYKGDPLVVGTYPPYTKAFLQPTSKTYAAPGAVLTSVLSRLTRQCEQAGSRYHRLLSLNGGTVVMDCFRVLQLLLAAKRLSSKRSLGIVVISAGGPDNPVLFTLASGVRGAIMPFYAQRVPRTSKVVSIEEIL